MGTYITTGIITEFTVETKSIENLKAKSKTPIDYFLNAVVDNPTSFNFSETEKVYNWTLKTEIMEKELKPFLEQYYNDMYGTEYALDEDCEEILSFLNTNPTQSEIEAYSQEAGNPNFSEVYNYRQNITVESQEISISIGTIMLSSEGKVSYESIFGHLEFFQKSLRKTYKQSPLGGCLIIDID
ncbi:hypothetical protein [Pedobacter sp.]|jgi:hypothetical protein|uniref:hypothetical protein n=1 Tax=Pedobacter sp. TaxID=1411316 RepID=UPI002D14915B|nr:hypothetical protein [Pedobacter sp.]HWW41925.1 hypothetical protein [Pedobacter sp.]